MIKPINAIRSTALALVTAGALLTGCANNNNTKASNQNQTEVVSKSVSDAIKANSVKPLAQGLEHNKKLEEKFLSYAVNNKEKIKLQRELDGITKDYGIFSASIAAQQFIDNEQMNLMLDRLLKDAKNEYVSTVSTQSPVHGFLERLDGLFRPELSAMEDSFIYTERMPSAKKCLDGYDRIIEQSDYLKPEDKQEYKRACAEFEKKQTNKNSTQALSDLVAFKVFTYDRLLFNRYFFAVKKNYQYKHSEYKSFDEYFENLFVKKAQPTP